MYSIIKNWPKEKREFFILIFLAVIFFFVYFSFYFSTAPEADLSSPLKFNSPDETSNYFFIKQYAEKGILRVFEPLNFAAENKIQPRSMAVVNGYLVPGGFLGIILIFGWLAKIFGIKIIFYLTPLFAVLAVLCFYQIIKRIFDSRIAFWSALLLFFHPAFWYFSARGLFPNVLFISLLIIGFYFLIYRIPLNSFLKKRGKSPPRSSPGGEGGGGIYINYILAGLFFGLAMTVRLSEIIWVAGAVLLLFLIYRKNLKWQQVVLFLIFIFLTFSPIFAYNQIFYGSPFLTAYNLGDENIRSVENQSVGWLVSFSRYVFPFGFYPRNVFKNFSDYFVGMFWWLAVPLAVGVSVFIKKLIDGKLDKKIQTYLFLYFFISLFLFVYYGSWLFYDNPAREVSVGTSYVRYWLPIYILSLPFIIITLTKFIDWSRGGKKKLLIISLCLIYFLFSFKLIFLDRNDGLSVVKAHVREYNLIFQEVNRLIEPEAVIIVDRADKIFFPEHRVIWPSRDDKTYKLIPQLVKILPLYYYGLPLPKKEIDYFYAEKLNPEIKIIKIRDFGSESLYKFSDK